ncbi:MAG: efflux RND transporter periplasmic adaptor subunit [Proteobacteria bacterium]|nr:efflux RND transporter periplasmic adaptor subunit [Pseudomonadota bacterium]
MSGCDQESLSSIPVITLVASDKTFEIHAEGELEAVKATPITAPAGTRRPQTLAWILPQFSVVKKGDVVARFDGSNFQLEVDESNYEIQKLAFSMLSKEREIDNNMFNFGAEAGVIDFEYQMAKQFNIDNPMLYTKIEMIDAADNEEFLEAKIEHIGNVEQHYEKKSETEIAVLDSSINVQQAKLNLNNTSLSALEVIAPHDGLLVLEKGWDGSLPQPGKAIFSGSKLASLPNLEHMQAKIFVPEVEAIGIKTQQKVKIQLHSYPNIDFSGLVVTVSQTAQPKERDNPIKFFTVTVVLNEQDRQRLTPGQRLDAVIQITEEKNSLAIPIQSVFREGENIWAYVKSGNVFKKRNITTGFCSSSQCSISSGLKSGEVIALSEPQLQ